ncbi:MAG TPA: nucleotidyltransferase family protein [Sandaracinaceae bacterium LLY-WYZ-13_1]|nr:nucleotidyltransferase family protein [Sandaracinaceae bacterium LLY-WYZ-13_1]
MAEPTIGGVLLAAGRSRRMGARDKLELEVDGVPMVRRAADALTGAGAAPVVAVVARDAVAACLPHGFEVAHQPRPEDGLASSLALGIGALRGRVDAALVGLGDMPWVTAAHARRVMEAFDPTRDRAVAPAFGGRRGHPVLLAAALFDEVRRLEGDGGARRVLARHAARLRLVPVEDDGVLRDVDRPGDLDR